MKMFSMTQWHLQRSDLCLRLNESRLKNVRLVQMKSKAASFMVGSMKIYIDPVYLCQVERELGYSITPFLLEL